MSAFNAYASLLSAPRFFDVLSVLALAEPEPDPEAEEADIVEQALDRMFLRHSRDIVSKRPDRLHDPAPEPVYAPSLAKDEQLMAAVTAPQGRPG